jgi:predicted AlkP superfamily pyrophosphatase or phosphodiesterase
MLRRTAALFLAAFLPSLLSAETRRLVVVSVDGMMSAYYTRADELGLRIPNLRRLMKEGAYASGVIGVLPTVTYPSHTTLITGVTPRVHGIVGNRIVDPLDRAHGAWYWFAEDIRVPTLVSAAAARHLTSGSVFWPVSVGLGTDWDLPEFWRPDSDSPFDLKLLKAMTTPGLLEDVGIRRGRPVGFPLVEQDRMDTALFILDVHRPHLMLVHLIDLDAAEHAHGPMTPEARKALEASDANLGALLGAIAKDGVAAETVFAVVSDHGFLAVDRTLRPNVLLKDAGLLTVNEKGKTTDWKAWFHVNGGCATLLLRDPKDAATGARVRSLVEAKKAEVGSGIGRVLGPDEIKALGGDAEAALALDAADGFNFVGSLDGPWSSPAESRGYHGYAPDRKEMQASFLVMGPGLTRKGDLGVIKMTQIAPTLARWLGVSLGPEADQPLPLFEPR